MFYRVEQEVSELIILMMHVAFNEGTEVIVRYFRELYLIDLKLPNHQAVEQFNLRALGRGFALPDSLPDLLYQETAPECQFSRVLRSLPRFQQKPPEEGGCADTTAILSELCVNEDSRKQTIEQKFQSQFWTAVSEDYQFATYSDMVHANCQQDDRQGQTRNEQGTFRKFASKLKGLFKGGSNRHATSREEDGRQQQVSSRSQ